MIAMTTMVICWFTDIVSYFWENMARDYKCSEPEKWKEENDLEGGCKVGRRSDKPQQSIMSLVIRKQKRLKNVFCKTEMAVLISAGWSSLNLYPFRGEMTTSTLGRTGLLEKQKPPEYSISLWSQVTGGFVISLCGHPSGHSAGSGNLTESRPQQHTATFSTYFCTTYRQSCLFPSANPGPRVKTKPFNS